MGKKEHRFSNDPKAQFFFASNLLLFYIALTNSFQIGIAFYIWMAIFSVMVLAQFWAFTTDLYNVKSGQRLFVVIMLGASIGGLVGAKAAVILFPLVGVNGLVLLSAIILMLTLLLSGLVESYIPDESKCRLTKDDTAPTHSLMGGFSVVARDPYLIVIAVFMIFLNWISTNGDYIMGEYVLRWAEQEVNSGQYRSIVEATGTFYADYIFWVNLISLILQAFVVSRLFRWLGIRGTILVLPIVLILAYGFIFILPIFSLIRLAKIAEKGTNLSIANTSRQALFLPTSREAKYEGKMAIETFFWRFGDLFSVATVYIGINLFQFSITEFVITNLILSIFLFAIALKVGHYHHQKITTNVMNEAPMIGEKVNNFLVTPGQPFTYIILTEAFYDPDIGDALKFKASSIDGSSLPKWIRFISLECCFVGKPPQNLIEQFELEIVITATDFDGLSACTTFKFHHY